MFRGLLKFSLRRTPLQAFGWYLAFLLILTATRLFAIAYVVLVDFDTDTSVREAFQSGIPGQETAMLYVFALGAMLLWNRSSALNILLVVNGASLSVWFGALEGLLPLAVLTTRPSSISPDVTKVFE